MFCFNHSCFENYFRYKNVVENIYNTTLDIIRLKLNSSMLNQNVSMFVDTKDVLNVYALVP